MSFTKVEEAEESLDFWWKAHQEWINAPLGKERDEGLQLCSERLAHFAKELCLARAQKGTVTK